MAGLLFRGNCLLFIKTVWDQFCLLFSKKVCPYYYYGSHDGRVVHTYQIINGEPSLGSTMAIAHLAFPQWTDIGDAYPVIGGDAYPVMVKDFTDNTPAMTDAEAIMNPMPMYAVHTYIYSKGTGIILVDSNCLPFASWEDRWHDMGGYQIWQVITDDCDGTPTPPPPPEGEA
jgi:hypothetical protein